MRVILGVGILLLIHSDVAGQANRLQTSPSWLSVNKNTTTWVAWGDMDGDGNLDLACGNFGEPNTVYQSTGKTLDSTPRWTSNESNNTGAMAWGDVDGDGDLDLVCGNYGQPNTLYRNDNGVLTASPIWRSNPAAVTKSVAWGDYDNDGDLDLVCGNDGPNRIYRNNGGALSVNAVWTSNSALSTNWVAWADYDGDGDLDLAVANSEGSFVYDNLGGTVSQVPSWQASPVRSGESIAWGDVDGDGDLDLAVGNGQNVREVSGPMAEGEVDFVYLNDAGSLQTIPAWTSGPLYATSSVEWGDYDGDGDLDLLCGSVLNKSASVYENTGDRLTTNPVWTADSSDPGLSAAWGDPDGDGDLDVAVAQGILVPTVNKLYRNDGALMTADPIYTTSANQTSMSVAWGDYDNDGDLDLASGNGRGTPERNLIFENNAGVMMTDPVWLSNASEPTWEVAWGDVDGDGYLDLACANAALPSGSPSSLYPNDLGALNVIPSWSSAPFASRSAAWGDVDGDGDLDLAFGNVGAARGAPGESNALYLNLGGQLVSAPSWKSGLKNHTFAVGWADVDGDGDPDLACGNYNQANTVYLNHGGTLNSIPAWSSNPERGTTSLSWGDYDGDGDVDLAFGNLLEPNTVYRNEGGTLTSDPVWSSRQLNATWSVEWVDVDGDGDLDLACGNGAEAGQPNTVYENQGGELSGDPVWRSTTTNFTNSVDWGDFDNDGDFDLACGNGSLSSPGPITIYANTVNSIGRGLPNTIARLDDMQISKGTGANEYIIEYVLVDPESDRCRIVADYSSDRGGTWQPAVETGTSEGTRQLSSSPTGASHVFGWDVSSVPGAGQNVIFRVRAISNPDFVGTVQRSFVYQKKLPGLEIIRPALSVQSRELDFGTVTLGDTISQAVSFSNLGVSDLYIDQVISTDPAFTLTTGFRDSVRNGLTIPPGSGVGTVLRFIPSRAGSVEGAMNISSNDPLAPITTVVTRGQTRDLAYIISNLYPDGTVGQGDPVNVTVIMRDSVEADSVLVTHRAGGDSRFFAARLTKIDDPVNDQYGGVIPGDAVTSSGVQYGIVAYRGWNTTTSEIRRLRVRVHDMVVPFQFQSEQYHLFSLPLEIESPITGVITDDLGGPDPARWRLFAYDTDANKYLEAPGDVSTFDTGRAYWLVTRGGATLDVAPAGGLSAPTDTAYVVALRPGWSLIGNPYGFPVEWDSVRVDTATAVEAVGVLVEPPWRFDPTAPGGPYVQDVSTLQPFEGYWINNIAIPERTIDLRIPPQTQEESAVAIVQAGPERADGWTLSVRASSHGVQDGSNVIGVRSGAKSTHDRYDRAEPPTSPGESVSLYFPHSDWEKHPGRYTTDVRGMKDNSGTNDTGDPAGQRWTFDVAKSFSVEAGGDLVELSFLQTEQLPDDAEAYLIDRRLERTIDIRDEGAYSFYMGERLPIDDDRQARFLILVGSGDFVENELPSPPTKTVLRQNVPNPFNPSTIIRYEIAEAGEVTLTVYDIRGALVGVVERTFRQPGRYETRWNGENQRGERVASGVYFCRLTTPGFADSRKMLLLK